MCAQHQIKTSPQAMSQRTEGCHHACTERQCTQRRGSVGDAAQGGVGGEITRMMDQRKRNACTVGQWQTRPGREAHGAQYGEQGGTGSRLCKDPTACATGSPGWADCMHTVGGWPVRVRFRPLRERAGTSGSPSCVTIMYRCTSSATTTKVSGRDRGTWPLTPPTG